MKYHAIRLHPGQDLKIAIQIFAKENNISAGIILTCVGSLSTANIRMADENISKKLMQKFEILTLTGTISQNGCHLHISISDSTGNILGGHVLDNCTIYTTAEIVIGEIDSLKFSREFDQETGFDELKISKL